MRKVFSRIAVFMAFSLFFLTGGCTCCYTDPILPTDLARRPQVMSCYEDIVIQYGEGDDEEEEDEEDQIEVEYCDCEEESDENLLDPYTPFEEYYRFAVGDILEISVHEEEELYVNHVVVAPDGRIYFGFIDGVYALGQTVPDVKKQIAKKLEVFYKEPQVSIILAESESLTFKILGRVQKPGLYTVKTPIRLREAISMAGGWSTESYQDKSSELQQIANLRASFIVRKNKKLDIDFEKLLYTADNSQNVYVQPGDYIFIAKFDIRQVYVLGAIPNPTVMPWKTNLTLMNAITYSGAWIAGNPYSPNIKKALLLRGNLNDPCVIHMDISKILTGEARDFYLEPGDIVYLPEKGFRFARELVRLAISTFFQAFGNAAGGYYASQVLFPVGPGLVPASVDTVNVGF